MLLKPCGWRAGIVYGSIQLQEKVCWSEHTGWTGSFYWIRPNVLWIIIKDCTFKWYYVSSFIRTCKVRLERETVCAGVSACVPACERVCVCACVRVCVHVCLRVCVCLLVCMCVGMVCVIERWERERERERETWNLKTRQWLSGKKTVYQMENQQNISEGNPLHSLLIGLQQNQHHGFKGIPNT